MNDSSMTTFCTTFHYYDSIIITPTRDERNNENTVYSRNRGIIRKWQLKTKHAVHCNKSSKKYMSKIQAIKCSHYMQLDGSPFQ